LKYDINKINKAFENRIRLGIMSLLLVENTVEFNVIKDALKLTDGNLASHIKALEKLEYIEVIKSFIGKKPNTKYKASRSGKKAFLNHLDALENLLNQHK